MPINDELGKRMKEYYENIPKTKLLRRTPVAIRIDGNVPFGYCIEDKYSFMNELYKNKKRKI